MSSRPEKAPIWVLFLGDGQRSRHRAQQRPLVDLLTNDGLPLAIGLRDLVGTAHLAKGHAADNEDEDAWPSAVLSGSLILVPVSIPSTDGATGKTFYYYFFILLFYMEF